MSTPISATRTVATVALMPGTVVNRSTASRKGRSISVMRASRSGSRAFEGLDLVQIHPEQKAVMVSHVPAQAGEQACPGGAQPAGGLRQEPFRVGLPRNPGTQQRAPARAQQVRDDAGDLDVGVLEGLLDAQRRLRHLSHQLLPGSCQVPQLLDGSGRHEAPSDQPMRQQVGQPCRIGDIALPAGDLAHGRRV